MNRLPPFKAPLAIRPAPFLLAAAGLILAMVLLGFAASAGWMQSIDLGISSAWVLDAATDSPALVSLMQGISWLGGGWPRWGLVLILCALLWRVSGSRAALALGAATLLANLASSLLKMAFSLPRPDLVPHLDHVSSAAYPSGHATSTAVVYLLLAALLPPRWRTLGWAVAIAMTLLNAASRLMLGVHWTSDILGGTLLGAAFALLGFAWFQRAGFTGTK